MTRIAPALRITLLCICALPALSGCVAQMAADVVTAPVRLASSGVDMLTTSQSEADENRGRALRKKEEKMGRISRKLDKAERKCSKGDEDQCEKAEDLREELDEVRAEDI